MKLLLENWRGYLKESEGLNLNWESPNFKHEWDEAQSYPLLSVLGYDTWIEIAESGREMDITLDLLGQIENTTAPSPDVAREEWKNLEPASKQRFLDALKSGVIEMPIVVKIDGKYVLLAGNHRLTGLVASNIFPIVVWLIDVDRLGYAE